MDLKWAEFYTVITRVNIIEHVSISMRKKFTSCIKEKRAKLSILVDESTTLSRKASLIIYIRVAFEENLHTVFLDLLELSATDASTIFEELLNCLRSYSFDEDYLSEHLVSFASDGASVMLGRQSGVSRKLSEKFPQLVIWHCIAHRLELAVNDSVEEVAGLNNFRVFLDKLYSLYHQSPKNQRELHESADSLGIQLLSIGRVLNTRWVASSERTVRAVWNNFAALHHHLNEAATDVCRDDQEKSTYRGLTTKLTSYEFVTNLAIMYDALEELADLSRALQRRETNIINAHRMVSREIMVLESLTNGRGRHLVEVADSSTFKGIQLHRGSKSDVSINVAQFFRSLANNLRSFFRTPSHHLYLITLTRSYWKT